MKVTFTGLDERTDLQRVISICEKNPEVEFAVLFSPKFGERPRYPGPDFMQKLAETAKGTALEDRLAGHFCGKYTSRATQYGSVTDPYKHAGVLWDLLSRIQVNIAGHEQRTDPVLFAQGFIANKPKKLKEVILQCRDAALVEPIARRMSAFNFYGVAMLFDKSGGKGELPLDWPEPIADIRCGYAGGLGPDSIANELPKLGHAAWIDMESRIRTDDWLDLDKCEQVVHFISTTKV